MAAMVDALGRLVQIDRQPLVYIYGEVQRPGAMRLERDMTLLQALATGGGLTLRGTEKGIVVHRKEADGTVRIIEPAMGDALDEGDVVFVRVSLFCGGGGHDAGAVPLDPQGAQVDGAAARQ